MTVVADVQRNSCMANRVIEIDSHRDPVGEAHIPPTGFEDHLVATPTGKCLKRRAEGRDVICVPVKLLARGEAAI